MRLMRCMQAVTTHVEIRLNPQQVEAMWPGQGFQGIEIKMATGGGAGLIYVTGTLDELEREWHEALYAD